MNRSSEPGGPRPGPVTPKVLRQHSTRELWGCPACARPGGLRPGATRRDPTRHCRNAWKAKDPRDSGREYADCCPLILSDYFLVSQGPPRVRGPLHEVSIRPGGPATPRRETEQFRVCPHTPQGPGLTRGSGDLTEHCLAHRRGVAGREVSTGRGGEGRRREGTQASLRGVNAAARAHGPPSPCLKNPEVTGSRRARGWWDPKTAP